MEIREATAKIIRYDGNPPRPIEDFKKGPGGETLTYFDKKNKDNLPVFTMPTRICGHLAHQKSDRYRLFESDPITVKVNTPTGRNTYETFYPWYYEIKRVQTGTDPENNEATYGDRTDWFENKTGVLKLSGKIGTKGVDKVVSPDIPVTGNSSEDMPRDVENYEGENKEIEPFRTKKEILDDIKERLGVENFKKVASVLCEKFQKRSYSQFGRDEFVELVKVCEDEIKLKDE